METRVSYNAYLKGLKSNLSYPVFLPQPFPFPMQFHCPLKEIFYTFFFFYLFLPQEILIPQIYCKSVNVVLYL